MDYRAELFKALTTGVEGAMRDKSIDALVEVCRVARKEGFNAGFKNGNINDGTFDEKIKEAYENGANDAWECAKNLLKGEYDQYKRFEIFGNTDVDNIFTLLTGAEALVKLKKYEEEQKKAAEIKIGDEVTDDDGWNGVVTRISPDGEYLVVTLQDGSALRWEKEGFKKTGRHFPQIEEVLQKMQEGNG